MVSNRRPTPEMRMTGPMATWSTGIIWFKELGGMMGVNQF
jgi:hypothetical protein